jgi:hypothetical protein
MNIWEELTAIGYTITDNRLRAAWGRMVHIAPLPKLPVGAGNCG